MIGRMWGVGITIGHSGRDPKSVSAIYHYPDLLLPCAIAAFAEGCDESVTEFEAVRLALSDNRGPKPVPFRH